MNLRNHEGSPGAEARVSDQVKTASTRPNAEDLPEQSNGAVSPLVLIRKMYLGCAKIPVFGSVLRKVVRKFLPPNKRSWTCIPSGPAKGLWLFVDLRFEPHLMDGRYETPAQEVLTTWLRPGDCFYDVGAHIGFFSLLAARLVGERGTVIAFEPDPNNASILRTTAIKNKMPQIRVVEAAAWSSSGPLEFQRADPASSGVDGQVGPIANLNRDRIRVSGVALDDYVLQHESSPPNFLKIDVEAAEVGALQGAAELFKTFRPSLLCEVHNVPNKARIEAWLQERLYSLEWLGPQDSLPIQLLALPRPVSDKVDSNARSLT